MSDVAETLSTTSDWDPVAYLDDHRGIIDSQDVPELRLYAYRRTNISQLTGAIGLHMAAQPNLPTDEPLEVGKQDLWRANFYNLNRGLYIPPGDPRYRRSKSMRIAIQHWLPLTLPISEGVQPYNVGVALGTGEYKIIATSPSKLAEAAMARALDANDENADREDKREKGLRAGGHALEDLIIRLESLDQQYIENRAVLRRVHKDARLVWRTAYSSRELNQARQQADELIHVAAEIAMNGLYYSTRDINAGHRALTHRLYRSGSANDLALQWRLTTHWAANYIKAKRGKVNQSLNGSREQLRLYQPHLDKAKSAISQD